MSNKLNIDLLNRESLVKLGIKLKIHGHTNGFNSPYLKKDQIKQRILFFFKDHKKKLRSKSLSNDIHNKALPMNRSKSLPDLNKLKNHGFNINEEQNKFSIKSIYPKVSKLVAIGDIHGDLSVAIKSLKLAGVISMSINDNIKDISAINWTGGNTYVVQLGDQIDRVRPEKFFNNLCVEENNICEDEGSDLKIICLFES